MEEVLKFSVEPNAALMVRWTQEVVVQEGVR